MSGWDAELRRAAAAVAGREASTIYFPIWAWPAFGAQLADAHFNLALAAADWAVRMPPTAVGGIGSDSSDGSGGQPWHTTDAQLAAALGIAMPRVPLPPQLRTVPPGAGTGNPLGTS